MKRRHRTIRLVLSPLGLAVIPLAACSPPDDIIFQPAPITPIAETGRFRLTANPGPDLVRGFNADGSRIVYRSAGLPGFGIGGQWRLLSVPTGGGAAREEASLYRAALPTDSVSTLLFDPGGRILAAWMPPIANTHGCGEPAPGPPLVVLLKLLRLDAVDGRPFTDVPILGVTPPTVRGVGTGDQLVRRTAADVVARAGGNPFGPAPFLDGSGRAYVSDGEAIWRFELDNPTVPAESLAPGAFPSLSPDGRQVVASRPVGVDSTADTTVVTRGFFVCVQVTVMHSFTGWETVVYNVGGGPPRVLGEGVEPRFDPRGGRVLVRRATGLYWLDLPTGSATLVPGTEGAHSAAISPNGSVVAFSAVGPGGLDDVFFVPLN